MRDLYTRPPKSPYRISLQDLFTSPIWDISIQDFLIYLDLLCLFRGALYKILSQDLHYRSLRKSSLQDLSTGPLWEIPVHERSTRSLHKASTKDLYERSLLQELFTKSPHKTSIRQDPMRGLFTRSPDISQPPGKTSLKDLLTWAPYKIFSQDLLKDLISTRPPEIPGPPRPPHRSSTKSLHQPQMRHLYTRSPDTPGPPRSLHKSSLQDRHKASMRDLFTRALYKVFSQDHHVWHLYTIQDLLISLDLLGLFTGALYKISSRDPYQRSLWEISITGAPSKISSQDLYQPRPLWNVSALYYKISPQDFYERSLYNISSSLQRSLHKSQMRHLYTGSPGIPGPPTSQ